MRENKRKSEPTRSERSGEREWRERVERERERCI
jgi:hypothetical protein